MDALPLLSGSKIKVSRWITDYALANTLALSYIVPGYVVSSLSSHSQTRDLHVRVQRVALIPARTCVEIRLHLLARRKARLGFYGASKDDHGHPQILPFNIQVRHGKLSPYADPNEEGVTGLIRQH